MPEAAYRTRQATAVAVQWDGTNTAEVAELAGVISDADGRLWVRSSSGPAEVYRGWWVSQGADGYVCAHSARAWDRYWEAVDG
jgi:hypothetical protein